MSGVGGGESEMNGNGLNNLYLYAPNSFTGGFVLGASSNGGTPPNAGVNFNNNTAFGVGGLISSSSSSAQRNILTPLAAQTPGALVLSQGLTLWAGVFSYSGVAIAPVTFTGNSTLTASGTSTIQVQSTVDAGAGTATLTLAGNVSGAGNLNKAGGGVLVLSGSANSYSGSTTITAGTLQLGAANGIATSSSVIMAGGTFNPGAFSQAMANTTLGLTSSSTIDFGLAGADTLSFKKSSALVWSGVLDLINWVPGQSSLQIGTDATGLTTAQLDDIEINGDATTLGTAEITAGGFIEVPEPSTALLGLLGLGSLWALRRRTA
jgi:MYXO-CTERM domain-containing protein